MTNAQFDRWLKTAVVSSDAFIAKAREWDRVVRERRAIEIASHEAWLAYETSYEVYTVVPELVWC